MGKAVRLALLATLTSALLPPGAAWAGDITVRVFDQRGKPVEDAVVMIDAPGPAPRAGHFEITQRDTQFIPRVLAIPAGSTVEFGNLDPFRHHVYSFSPARAFELKLFGKGEKRPVRFDRAGAVAIGCNIHDSMQAFIVVSETRFFAKSDADGTVVLRGVPPGRHAMRVWQPDLRAPGNQLTQTIDGARSQSLRVDVRLRRAAPSTSDY